MGKKNKRSRSPSSSSSGPPSTPNRSRRSPKHGRIKIKQENGSSSTSSKVASYFEARTKLSADLQSKKSKFASDPKSHPEYKSVWTKFYQRKQKKAEKPLSVEELQPDWVVKWRKFVDDWHDRKLTSERKKLRRSLGLKKKTLRRVELKMKQDNHEIEGSEDGEIVASQSLPGSQSSLSNRDSLGITILETLVFLNGLNRFLGEWGDKIETARQLCLKVEAEEPGKSAAAVKDERFGFLLDGCMRALENSLQAGRLRRTREIDEGMTKMRFLKSLTQDSGTVLTPDSPSPARSEKLDRQPRKTASTATLTEPSAITSTRMAQRASVEPESVIRTLRLLSAVKDCLDELKIEVVEYLKIANTLEFQKGPSGSDWLLTDNRFINVLYRMKMKLLYLIILDNPMLVEECKKSVNALLSRTSLASASNGLTMPPLPPVGLDPLISGHAAQQLMWANNGSQPVRSHEAHPLLMGHGTQPMMPYGAQALMCTSSQVQADSVMRAAVQKFTDSLRRQNYGQKNAQFPGLRSSTPIGDMSPIPSILPHNNLQVTQNLDQMLSSHRQSSQGHGWFKVNPAGSHPPNPTQKGFKVPGILPNRRPTNNHQPGPPPPQKPRPSATVVSGALLELPPAPQNILRTAISSTLKEAFGSRQNYSDETIKKIESRVRKSIVHIKQEISETREGQKNSSNSSLNISGNLSDRLKSFKKLDEKQKAQLLREIQTVSVENPEALKEINAVKENLL